MQKFIVFCSSIIVVTMVSSCATTGGAGAPKAQAYSLQGCGAGAVAGGLLGLISGSDNALKGAAFGCGVGAIIAYSIAKRTNEYVDANQAMDAEIARNQKNTKTLQAYNAKLAQGIQSYQKQIQVIQLAHSDEGAKQKKLNTIQANANKQLNKAESALKSVNAELVVANKQYKSYQAKASKATVDKPKKASPEKTNKANNDKKWQSEIANLEKEKQILSKHVKSLSALSASI
jgi:hypothetical protein